MKRKRRETEVFSLSFLDVITCGFGAIVLLLMVSRAGLPVVLEQSPEPRQGIIADLQQNLFEVRGEAKVLNRDLNAKREQLSQWKEKVARLTSELASLEGKKARTGKEVMADAALKGRLETALQQLTEEMQRLLAQRQQVESDLVGGIPVDSEYIIFVIDTSGSMFNLAWDRVVEEINDVLDLYPKVKGMQIMNDMGTYMFSDYRGKWFSDTPGRRKIIADRLRGWNPFSNSSPVEGIEAAIRAFYRPDRKISIYYFGDDFNGGSIQRVIKEVERLNPVDNKGVPQIRIHAVGFPVQYYNTVEQVTGMRFAALMRELCDRNMGTFVGLNDFRGTRSKLDYTITTPF